MEEHKYIKNNIIEEPVFPLHGINTRLLQLVILY